MASPNRNQNIFVFGLALGVFLAIYVVIGGISNMMKFRLEIIQQVAASYVIATYQNDFFTYIQKIFVGALWAFLDGFIVGISFMLIYKKFNEMIHGE